MRTRRRFVTITLLLVTLLPLSLAAPVVVGAECPTDFCQTVTRIPCVECEALVALYDSTNGAGWSNEVGRWLDSPDPASWFGITLAEEDSGAPTTHVVTRICLGYNELSGSIPLELGNLANLTELWLYGNQLSGSIPSELGNLTNLMWLSLSQNQLTESIPSNLGDDLTNLRFLELWGNQLTGPIPPELGNLDNLEYLYLWSNHLSGSIPNELGNLSRLFALHLAGNHLSGALPVELGGLSDLRFLILQNNILEGQIPSAITGLNLWCAEGALDLGYNRFDVVQSGAGVQEFLDGCDPDWANSQTVPPSNLHVVGSTDTSVSLAWTPIAYQADGGYYEVWYAKSGGDYLPHGITADKSDLGYEADGLTDAPEYSFLVRTYTPPHGEQQNELWSHFSGELVWERTLVGSDVPAILGEDVEVTFAGVSEKGITSLTTSSQPATALAGGFELLGQYHDIVTTASYVGGITVTIHYDDTGITPEEEAAISLLHYDETMGQWVDCTVSRNTEFNTVTGHVSSLSSFASVINLGPMVGSIVAPVDPVELGTPVDVTADFTDVAPHAPEGYDAVWDWGDGSTSEGTVTEADGSLTVSHSHSYTAPGVYTIKLTVTDGDDFSGESVFEYVVVYDPEGGFVTGGGWIDSPEGAYAEDPSLTGKANFGFVSKYKKGADVPTGQTQFRFKVADLNFHSTSYQWLVIAGPQAKFKGIGTINGAGNYGFMLTARDGQVNGGGGVDLFRIKIWDKDDGDAIVYDNQMGDDDDVDAATEIGGGSIVIHKK